MYTEYGRHLSPEIFGDFLATENSDSPLLLVQLIIVILKIASDRQYLTLFLWTWNSFPLRMTSQNSDADAPTKNPTKWVSAPNFF